MAETKTYNGYTYTQQPDGSWQRGAPVAPANAMPANPTFPYEAPKAEADARRAQAEAQQAFAVTPYAGPEAAAAARKAEADARIAEANAAAEADGRVKQTAASRQEALKGFQDTRLLDQAITELETLYLRGPGSTDGFPSGFKDFLPSENNKRFDRAGNQVRAFVKGVLQFTGQENNTPMEAQMNFGPYVPQASDYDGEIRDKISALRRLRDSGYQRAVQLLGGVPNERGEVIPLPQGMAPTREAVEAVLSGRAPGDTPNAMDQIYIAPGAGTTRGMPDLAPVGQQTIRNMRDIPPEANEEIDQLRAQMLSEGGGRLDPAKYAAEANRITEKYGFQTNALDFAVKLNEYLDAGGRTIPSGFLPPERLATASETARNNLLNNPLSAALVGGANTLSFGAVEALAPDQMMALRDAQGGSVLAGEVVGAIGGTQGLARGTTGALSALGRVAGRPNLAQSIASRVPGGQFGRNVLTDTAYGAAYGQNTQGDAATGAALGALGSVAGQGIGRGIGAGIGGLRRTPEAQALRDAGVDVSVARQVGAGRAEDFAQSVPFAGEAIRGRQMDSFESLNRAMMQEGGEPIGFVPTQAGREGVESYGQAVSNTYNQSVQGVTAPLDRQFLRDMVPVRKMARQMSPTNRAQLAESLRDAMQLPMDARAISAQQFQDAASNLKALRSNAKGAMPNSAQTLRNAATKTIEALEGAMQRAGGQNVIDGLGKANLANRGLKVSQDAILKRAAVGTQAGEVNVATPAQWLGALSKAEQSGYGQNVGMRTLAENAQRVLPSTVPNSGTADRLMAVGLLGAAGSLGGASSYDQQAGIGSAVEGAGSYSGSVAGAGALLGLLGTRRGQMILEKALISRPQALQTVGQGFRRRAGLFGSTGGYLAQPGQDTIQVPQY